MCRQLWCQFGRSCFSCLLASKSNRRCLDAGAESLRTAAQFNQVFHQAWALQLRVSTTDRAVRIRSNKRGPRSEMKYGRGPKNQRSSQTRKGVKPKGGDHGFGLPVQLDHVRGGPRTPGRKSWTNSQSRWTL